MSSRHVIPSPPTGTAFKLSSPRGASLATRTWAPSAPPRAILLIVHGGGWHCGYFAELALSLVADGIFCAAYDQPGCGYSDPEPSAPPGCIHFHSFDDNVDDLFAAVAWARKEAASDDAPVYLLGESFGALHVLAAVFQAEKRGVSIAGVVTLGALIRVCAPLLPPPAVIRVLSFVAPLFPRIKLPAIDLSLTFDAAFGDRAWARVARADEQIEISPRPTLMAMKCSLSTGQELLARAAEFPVPLMAIHGARDCRTDISAVHEFVDKAGTEASIVVIDTDGHQLLQDIPSITHNVIGKVSNWITSSLD